MLGGEVVDLDVSEEHEVEEVERTKNGERKKTGKKKKVRFVVLLQKKRDVLRFSQRAP